MIDLLLVLGIISCLVLSFVSSGMETALYRASRVRMRIREERGEWRAAWVNGVAGQMDGMVTTILVDNNISAYAGTYFLSAILANWHIGHPELVTTAVITPLFFVLTESLPKQLAFGRADTYALELIRVFAVFRWVLRPMVWVLNTASAGLRRVLGAPGEAPLSHSRRTLLIEHFNAGVAEHVLSEEQNRMAARIMELERISAMDAMIPLSEFALLSVNATRKKAVACMVRRRAQMALLIDSAGKPIGAAVTMNALVMQPGKADDPLGQTVERLERIRGETAIPEVLGIFRTRHTRMAAIVDRNRIVGVITSQSVLDRIAGAGR
jgi:Hemolysins and related proteins containing CBS domains